MSAPKSTGSPPATIAVDLEHAAGLLDLSADVFREHVLPQLAVIEITPRCRRIAVSELERWASVNGERVA